MTLFRALVSAGLSGLLVSSLLLTAFYTSYTEPEARYQAMTQAELVAQEAFGDVRNRVLPATHEAARLASKFARTSRQTLERTVEIANEIWSCVESVCTVDPSTQAPQCSVDEERAASGG
jgi:hypothetical protein